MTYRLHKYRAQPVEVDGIRFASKAEAKRYGVLKLLEKAGEIEALELQPEFPVAINGKHVFSYFADFSYRVVNSGKLVVEDVKGVQTDTFRLKRKCVEAFYPKVKIEVVKA